MEAIVLAGGKGTRLKSIVKDIPKPMALINNTPFLTYLFDFLNLQGIKKVILSVGYKYEQIEQYYKNSYKNLKLLYSIEREPLGTGGAIKKALDLCDNQNIFFLNGDTFFNIDLNKLLKFHQFKKADLSIAIKLMNNFDRYGTVTLNKNNQITAFKEKTFCKEGYINGGIYLLKKEHLKLIKEEKFSFEKDFMEKYFNTFKFYGQHFDDYFIDIGIPEDYEKAQKDLLCLK